MILVTEAGKADQARKKLVCAVILEMPIFISGSSSKPSASSSSLLGGDPNSVRRGLISIRSRQLNMPSFEEEVVR
eukprot:12357974-Prorocentrum_lima.AAC.2